MKVKITNWRESKRVERIVATAIKKFHLVRDRENYLKARGLDARFSYLRVYKGVGKYEDYLFRNKGIVERRIIVGRTYDRGGDYRPSRSAI